MSKLVVVESPLKAATPEMQRENLRYLLWCMRAEYLSGNRPAASHLGCPWFMDDADSKERRDGIDWPWLWSPGVPHHFWIDNDYTAGMIKSRRRREDTGIPLAESTLRDFPHLWSRYQAGEWPPHTAGFEVAR